MTHILNYEEVRELFSTLAMDKYLSSCFSILMLPGHPIRFSVIGVDGKTVVTGLDANDLNLFFEEEVDA